MNNHPIHKATIAAMLMVVGACETGSTDPEPNVDTFDAQAAMEDYQAVDAILQSAGFQRFIGLERHGAFDDVASESGAPIVTSLNELSRGGGSHDFASALMDRLASSGAAAPGSTAARAPIISALHRGDTFVYDPERADWVVDPDRPGAPDHGVRFIVYEEPGGVPDPSQEVGYADLLDEGDGSIEDVALRLVVVIEGQTALDYRTTLDEADGGPGGTVTVSGNLQGDGGQLDFDIEVTGSDDGADSSVDIDFQVAVASRDFSIAGSLAGSEGSTEVGDLDLEVRHGAQSIRVDVGGTDTEVAGTFYLNGEVFVTVSGHPDAPTFVTADGDPLMAGEVAVLLRVLAVVADVFQLFQDLVEPVGHLVLLGVVL